MSVRSSAYCRGYVAFPIVEALRRRGFFERVDHVEYRRRDRLGDDLGAHPGHFEIALEMLEALGWLESRGGDAYRLVAGSGGRLRLEMGPLYAVEPRRLFEDEARAEAIADLIRQVCFERKTRDSADAALARGALMVPLILAFRADDEAASLAALDGLRAPIREAVSELFVAEGWLTAARDALTDTGREWLLRRDTLEEIVVYRQALADIDAWLFGDRAQAFAAHRAAVEAAGFAGGLLYPSGLDDALEAEIAERFGHPSSARRPATLIVLAGDDATLRERLGRIAQRPVDAVATLDALADALVASGEDGEAVVVHSLRPDAVAPAVSGPADTTLPVLAARHPTLFPDRDGGRLAGLPVLAAWRRALCDLRDRAPRARLLLLQPHSAPYRAGADDCADAGVACLDALRRLTCEFPIGAEDFICLAASVGLFNDKPVARHPRAAGVCRATLHALSRREYTIRHAGAGDLERLCELEKLCWQHTRTPKKLIRARLQKYPEGQFVLERDGAVLGVVYSQRIASVDGLDRCTAADVHTLHDPSGSTVQLLAVNVDPRVQNLNYGDQLLEFMLQRCALVDGVDRVVGVTLCKSYRAGGGQSFADYIRREGAERDPVLAFHDAHGADIVKPMPGYRPEDLPNQGNGVLVSYDILRRQPRRTAVAQRAAARVAVDEDRIAAVLRAQIAELLGVDATTVDADRPVMEMGLDSADLLQLQQRLEATLGQPLESGFFFEHGTLRKVLAHCRERFGASRTVENAETAGVADSAHVEIVVGSASRIAESPLRYDATPEVGAMRDRSVAIVGMACTLPGGIDHPERLWDALVAGESKIGAYPAARGPWADAEERPGIDRGGFVRDADAFDAAFFRMSPAEALVTDPQQRMLMELAWACAEDAGILPSTLQGTRTGVFVGASNADYSRLLQQAGLDVEAHHGVGSSLAILANRISYFFDLSGPSLLVDTACSSSLVALHMAVRSLRSGECPSAFVGGVNLICHPDLSVAYHKAGMLAPDGLCKVFDARANGYVRSEGAVMLLLKPLDAAIADGDRIHAVIRGTAMNHGGLASGLTVPNPQKQAELLYDAWRDAGIAAQDLGCLEAHGTGTALGDPIEVQGMRSAWARLADGAPAIAGSCAIGSLKSNLGHLESAAGLAGLLKVVLSMQHRRLPATLHFERLNPKIALDGTPFRVQGALAEWPGDRPRIAGVSSFGSGGANAHAVLEEYPQPPARDDDAPGLFVLSAADPERLREAAMRALAWLSDPRSAGRLGDAIRTWQRGRTAMPQRLAIVLRGRAGLIHALQRWLAGETDIPGLHAGRAAIDAGTGRTDDGVLADALARHDHARLAAAWVAGAAIDWRRLHADDPGATVSLPTYPFARERFWATARTATATHPLLQTRIPSAQGRHYRARFDGGEFFFADHRVRGHRVLPAVAYLEMAVAAAVEAGLDHHGALQLRDLVWTRPLAIEAGGEPASVSFALDTGVDARTGHGAEFEITSGTGDGIAVHCRGAVVRPDAVPVMHDLAALSARMTDGVQTPERFYPACARLGLDYGPQFRAIAELRRGRGELLARLRLPDAARKGDYRLHPSLMDGVLQAALALIAVRDDHDAPGDGTPVPFALDRLQVLSACGDEMVAWVRPADGTRAGDTMSRLDIDLCAPDGRVCVRLQGFATRTMKAAATAAPGELVAYAPVWSPLHDAVSPASAIGRVLVLGGDASQRAWLGASGLDVDTIDLPADAAIADWQAALQGREIAHLLWLAPDASPDIAGVRAIHDRDVEERDIEDRDVEDVVASQALGTVAVFRIVKALLALGHGERELRWTLITAATLRVKPDDAVRPAHAGVSGLVGSLAKEYPHWRLTPLDMDTLAATTAAACLAQPPAPRGDAVARRDGEWFRRRFARMPALTDTGDGYREGGVYVVIGGAGGLGEAWTRFMIERHRAQVIWIGRGAHSPAIEAKCAALAASGPAPVYLSVDATDPQALRDARDAILRTHGAIHGVVHSALVLHDRGLAQMEESGFRAALAAKVDVGVGIDRAFGDLPLDFVLFFSSMMSFIKPPGQANYTAGCTFKDAYALALGQRRPYPVKVVHWGFWGGVGSVADEPYRQSMARNGIGSIDAVEGMEALRAFMASGLDRIGLIRTVGDRAIEDIPFTERLTRYPAGAGEVFAHAPETGVPVDALAAQGGGLQTPALDAELAELLAATLVSLGFLGGGVARIADLPVARPVAGYYERWLDNSLRCLRERGWLDADDRLLRQPRALDALWAAWAGARPARLENPNLRAQVALVEACLAALPQILRGERLATEVMFPESSMRLVEGIYRANAVSDGYNRALGETLAAYAAHRVAQGATEGLRILEIGAGTGGTTTALIPVLERLALDEYCYTDVSRAFLMYAEEHYRPRLNALVTAIFDVSRPLSAQTIAPDRYDVVVATNVLHATPDIRETLRNAKAALKRGGVLLLNEISNWSLFSHLTFGLLEGWWLHADGALRLPGSPGIAPAQWDAVLAEEGFAPVLFPARTLHGLGQQIVAAVSDGWVRQRIEAAASQSTVVSAAAPTASPSTDRASVRERALAYFRDLIASTLKLPAERIEPRRPLADYGLDSILVGQLTYRLRKDFADVPATLFFEVHSLDGLVDHCMARYGDTLAALLAPAAPTAIVVDDDGRSLRQRATAHFRGLLADTLKLPAQRIEPRRPLADYGLDSILVGQLTYRLRKDFADVPATLFFEVPDLDGLVDHFMARHRDALASVLGEAVASSPAASASRRDAADASTGTTVANVRGATDSPGGVFDVAIVGLAGRYPKSDDLDAFWDNLAHGRSCIEEIPADRWRWEDYYDPERGREGRMYTRWGGFLSGIDRFDPLFFRISPKEAKRIDPQERLFLETCYHAIEDAGYTPDSLDAPDRVGVFVGVMNARYTAQPSHYSIANRVSYVFDFRGASMAVDTACSSSLTAIHVALESLYADTLGCAIVGGVNLVVDPVHFLELSELTMLSAGDRCRAFGAQADGFVDAEGVGAIVLKPLHRAQADGDRIHGVIKGSAVNAGGRTNGYTVPNPLAQSSVVAQALARAGVPADHLSCIEAHGTGTALGDPIEIAGLTRAFGDAGEGRPFCAIGSVKSNIGHCESAAGIAGVTKVLLQMRHRQLVPSLHAEVPNPEIDFARTPFRVQKTLEAWSCPLRAIDGVLQEIPRIAGVSSFGAGGANAHVVLQEYIAPIEAPVVHPQVAIVLSARTAEQLRRKAADLLAFARAQAQFDLTAMAYTLQVGREALDERAGFVVDSVAALIASLSALAATDPASVRAGDAPHGIARGHARRDRASLARHGDEHALSSLAEGWAAAGDLARLVDAWTRGLEFDWRTLYRDARPKRIGLPLYPFARDRYWREDGAAGPHGVAAAMIGTARLHSLLHENVSDLQGQRYASRFGGEEPLLRDHVVATADGARRALPAMALLEMARAAAEHAQPARAEGTVPELRDAVWAQPLVVAGETRVDVGLQPGRDGGVDYEIACTRDGTETIHAQGAVHVVAAQASMLDLGGLRARMTRDALSSEAVYAQCERLGLTCGPRLRTVSALRRGTGEALVELRLPAGGAEADQTLSPTLLEGALHGAQAWLAAEGLPDRLPFAVARLRVLSACGPEMFAWLRFADGGAQDAMLRLDVDLCDAQGRVCIELRGCAWRAMPRLGAAAPTAAVPVVEKTAAAPALVPATTPVPQTSVASVPPMRTAVKSRPAPKPIAFLASTTSASVQGRSTVTLDAPSSPSVSTAAKTKPSITLPAPAAPVPGPTAPRARSVVLPAIAVSTDGVSASDVPQTRAVGVRPSIVLVPLDALPSPVFSPRMPVVLRPLSDVKRVGDVARRIERESAVELFDCGEGHYTIRIDDGAGDGNRLSDTLIEHLLQALDRVRTSEPKVLTLEGAAHGFLRGGRRECDRAIERGLFRAIAACPCPTIAVAQGDARGAGLLVALLCDLLVLGEDARYGYVDGDLWPGAAELSLCAARLGTPLAEDLLYATTTASGAELRARGWTCAVTSETSAHARTWVESLLSKSTLSLSLLKAHLSRDLASLADALAPAGSVPAQPAERTLVPGGVAVLPEASATGLQVADLGHGVIEVGLRVAGLAVTAETLFADLDALLARLREGSACRAVVLSSDGPEFLPGSRLSADVLHAFRRTVANAPMPIVAALEGGARGGAWLAALCCDAVVHAEAGRFTAEGIDRGESLRLAAAVFPQALDRDAGHALPMTGVVLDGAALRERAPAVRAVPASDVRSTALALATHWATLPAETLGTWKAWRAAEIEARLAVLPSFETMADRPADSAVSGASSAPTRIALASPVVSVTAYPDGVVVVEMADRDARNMFSDALRAGMAEAFAHIVATPAYRAVVLTGYDRYFSSGGTRDNLLAIQSGDASFTDYRIFETARQCPLPVIAAMQGHGIGAGWTLGMLADAVVLGAESRYLSPYMNYGFTPGAGATWMLAERMGRDLANESLLTAEPTTGAVLRARGLRLPVLPAVGVIDAALAQAHAMARAGRESLIERKRLLSAHADAALAETYRLELAMHERTFVGDAGTLARIEHGFGSEGATPVVPSAVEPPAVAAVPETTPRTDRDDIVGTLRHLLAQALHMPESEIDDDTRFVDLGLDSISGVTWIRRINAHYGTTIEATRVYRYPTLAELSRHLADLVSGAAPAPVASPAPASVPSAAAPVASTPVADAAPVRAVLRGLLAHALHLAEDEIDDDVQFVDLGLDSISGVTWIRRINAHYGTSIEATRVYRHPTLARFAAHVAELIAPATDGSQVPSSRNEAPPAPVVAVAVETPASSTTGQSMASPSTVGPSITDIRATLRGMLGHALHLAEDEVDDDAQFVDLGLDSISGVTWIRRINAHYGTSIEATRVYRYPTLAQFSAHVATLLTPADMPPPTSPVPQPAPVANATIAAPAPVVPVAATGTVADPGEVQAILRASLASALHLGEHEIDPDTQFVDLGLDSISGVTWVRRINQHYGTSIEATRVYRYPTLARLSRHVWETIGGVAAALPPSPPPSPAVPAPQPQAIVPRVVDGPALDRFAVAPLVSRRGSASARGAAIDARSPIAVIGMAGQFPQARDLDAYWRNLAEGRDCIVEVPAERWDMAAHYRAGDPVPGKANSKWMGALEDYDRFDPLFFSLSPTEAEAMDPQQRLFLQACWQGIEHAGYDARALSGSRCGVFVGCTGGDYHHLSRGQLLSAQGFTGGAISILAARIAYLLNLQGPCLSIDTACSSSLVALATACDSLAAGNSDVALAGGVYVMATPELHIKTSQAGMLSTTGRCFTFDQRADGFVPGEGVGVVMLKRLADAERDGDVVHAVIEGWGVNQDGKTNGITAPNPDSQARLEQEVYDRFGIDPAGIQLIEAHGTGTKLGDPIEVEGLKLAFAKYTRDTGYCALGSVKSNIGHCATAAGIAGVIKLVLAIRHRQLPPTIHYDTLNEHIDLAGSPFYVNDTLRPWTPANGARRRSAVSSFGFSGTNAHIVIAEPVPSVPAIAGDVPAGDAIVPLSAKTPEQLRQKAIDLVAFLRGAGAGAALADVAYTLQIGREPMDERLGVLASGIDDLVARLQDWIDGGAGAKVCHRGHARQGRDGMSVLGRDEEVQEAVIATCLASRKLSGLVDLWVKGIEFDWHRLYGGRRPRRIPLPTYPFARERYWVEADVPAPVAARSGATALHPLVHANTSDLAGQRYTSTFDGDESFLADHRVSVDAGVPRRVLPGVAYLEMARAAVASALPPDPERDDARTLLELRNVVWAQPVLGDGGTRVHIALSTEDAREVDYEICSEDGIVHGQGRVVVASRPVPTRLDPAAIEARMTAMRIEADALYALFEGMGLHYGPAHRGIVAVAIGRDEVFARLHVPAAGRADLARYALHPGLADSALQACVGLICDPARPPRRPLVPFALDALRVFAPCTSEMTAWLRYAPGSHAGDRVVKLDIDLCDAQGGVCAEFRGFAARVMDGETRADEAAVQDEAFDSAYYERLIADIASHRLSVDEALALG